jgi:hypothetical protein
MTFTEDDWDNGETPSPAPNIKCSRGPVSFPESHYNIYQGARVQACRKCSDEKAEQRRKARKRAREAKVRDLHAVPARDGEAAEGEDDADDDGEGNGDGMTLALTWQQLLKLLKRTSTTTAPCNFLVTFGPYDNVSGLEDPY